MKTANDVLAAIAIVSVLAVLVLKVYMAWQDRREQSPERPRTEESL
jgi:type II secretory pathway pseudopilin PulG